jgi:hypothetical protein
MKRIAYFTAILSALFCSNAFAYEKEIHEIEIIKNKFVPSILKASKNKVLKIKIFNRDKTIEEFESFDLKREKIVPGKRKITITVGPLKPGEYGFFGEFHPETAQGKLVVQ